MREFLVNNKSKIIRVLVLMVLFLIVVTYVNGRNIYKQKTKMMKERTENISINQN